jgi:hypothetical protein
MVSEKVLKELLEVVKEDILMRYCNPEYWDVDFIHDYLVDKGVDPDDVDEYLEELERINPYK